MGTSKIIGCMSAAFMFVVGCSSASGEVAETSDSPPTSEATDTGSVADMFTENNVARASSIVVGEIVDERVGRLYDPRAETSPDDCEVADADQCQQALATQSVVQQYDAVVAVADTVSGKERSEALLRRYRTTETSPGGEIVEHAKGYSVGDRVIAALIPGVDGQRDHHALVLTVRDGHIVADHFNDENEFRAAFDSLSEAEAIDRLVALASSS